MFCKLFNTELGQILVKKDTNEDCNPEVRFYFEPENLGVCSIAASQKDGSEESWNTVDELFDKINEEEAFNTVKSVINEFLTGQ
jgi:hypothetical protein